jgi:hypothetical protein
MWMGCGGYGSIGGICGSGGFGAIGCIVRWTSIATCTVAGEFLGSEYFIHTTRIPQSISIAPG